MNLGQGSDEGDEVDVVELSTLHWHQGFRIDVFQVKLYLFYWTSHRTNAFEIAMSNEVIDDERVILVGS